MIIQLIFLVAACISLQQTVIANEKLVDQVPVAIACNPGPRYSLLNSIECHPKQNLFCVTCSHNNKVLFYKISASGVPEMVQSLGNPSARLHTPQHAAFSPDGKTLVVANWGNQTLTVYKQNREGDFFTKPVAMVLAPSPLSSHKPHGIALSPCGAFLAVAYGAASYHGKAVALYRLVEEGLDFELVDMLEGPAELPGIPKGITFSPDGSCLLVTFSDANCLVIYTLSEDNTIVRTSRQVIGGKESGISRPEDVKIFANGKYCAVSNSDRNTVTYYSFDPVLNRVTQNMPCEILQNPEANFHFPHGLAFSPDGAFMLVTQFGHVEVTEDGDVIWGPRTNPKTSKFNVYRVLKDGFDPPRLPWTHLF